MIPLVCVMLVCRWYEMENYWLIIPWGAIFFFTGFFIRVWAQMYLHYRLKVKMKLTTTGPYRYVRNPIYIGNTLILVGICIMSGLLWFVPLAIAHCALVYTFAVKFEENHLQEKYGRPYQEYLQQVPRWIPHLKNLGWHKSGSDSFFLPSIKAEAHNFLLVLLPILKVYTPHG